MGHGPCVESGREQKMPCCEGCICICICTCTCTCGTDFPFTCECLRSEAPSSTIVRPPFEDGLRCARCLNCGMGWVEHEQQKEGFLPPGPRNHQCPEPFDRQTARWLLDSHASTGVPTTQRIKARIRLGLRDPMR